MPHNLRPKLVHLATLLFAMLTFAPVAWSQSPASPPRLQVLVNDAVAQLQLSYRHDAAERQQRYEMIGRAIAAWNQSPRSQADNERLAEWLRGSMRASMPGSREALPALPDFDRPVAENVPSLKAPPTPSAPSKQNDAAPKSTTAEPTPTELPAETESTKPGATAAGEQGADQPSHEKSDGDPFQDDPLPGEKQETPNASSPTEREPG